MFHAVESTHWQLDHYGVLARLLFNQQAGAKSAQGVFRALGFVHLFSASGIHIYAILAWIERATGALHRFTRGQNEDGRFTPLFRALEKYAGFAFLALVWSVQGFRPGFARPILIYTIRTYAREQGIKWQLFYPLLITLVLEIWIKPQFIPDSPPPNLFMLHYYLAVGGGLWCADQFDKKGALVQHFAMAVGSWLWIAPFDLWNHGLISVMTPVWSLLSLPVISFLLYPASLIAWVLTGSIPPALVLAWNHFLDLLLFLSDHTLSFFIIPPRAVHFALLFTIVFFFISRLLLPLLHRFFHLAFPAACFFLLLFIRIHTPAFLNNDQTAQLDVGQGDSALIIRDQRTEMIDVGSARTASGEDWIHHLARHGVEKVDAIALSHLDEDHVGALSLMLPWIPVTEVQTHHELWLSEKGERLSHALDAFPEVKRVNEKGSGIQTGEITWFHSKKGGDGNELMLAAWIPIARGRGYYAAGDADVSQEEQALEWFRPHFADEPVRIWKVSHHGSRFSSSPEVLRELQPKLSWISVGRHNRYHHPHPLTIETLRKLQLPHYRTDEAGDLTEYTVQSYF